MKEGIEYRYVYKKDENPAERLKNKLSAIFTLIPMMRKLKFPEPLNKMIKDTEESLEDVKILLDDIEKCDC